MSKINLILESLNEGKGRKWFVEYENGGELEKVIVTVRDYNKLKKSKWIKVNREEEIKDILLAKKYVDEVDDFNKKRNKGNVPF